MPRPSLVQIQKHPAPVGRDTLHCERKLPPAVAARRAEHVAGQTPRVDAHEHSLPVPHLTPYQRDVRLPVDEALVGHHLEFAVIRWQGRRGHAPDEAVVTHAVADEVGDGDHQQVVAPREPLQLRHAGHGAVIVHDLADDPGRIQAGEPRQIDRRFRLTGPHEDPAVARPEREDVARPREVAGPGRGIDRRPHRRRPIGRGDAGRRAFLDVDGHGERRLEAGRVVGDGHRDLQLVEPAPGHGEADQPPPVAGHEVDRLRRHLVRGEGQVALVLPILVVDHDDHPPCAKGGDGVVDRSERAPQLRLHRARPSIRRPGGRPFPGPRAGRLRAHCSPRLSPTPPCTACSARTTCLPMISHSMLTGSPTEAACSRVSDHV